MCDQCDILRRELREAREEIAAWREHDATPTVADTERVGRWTQRLKVTVGQARALIAFCATPDRVLTREDLTPFLRRREDVDFYDRSVDTHVKRIRRTLEAQLGQRVWIEAIYGLGYAVPVEAAALLKAAAGEAA